uniref:Cation/H+ exchanger transmembrane domain-containing protein n=1 Tax=Alexandrium andersonii TaxID=327968 RepID=A0A7S2GDE3_9DINO
MSGIITVLFCAIMLSAYTPPHLSPDGIRYFSFLLKQLASLCDMLIFVFVGVSAVRVTSKDLILSAWLMFYVLVSRAAAIFPLGLLCNAIKACVGRKLPAEKRIWISWKHMVMMWHGGVCRGGVSLWMGTELGNWVDESNGTGTRQRLISATFVLICVFLLIFGGTTSLCMRGLGLPMGADVSTGKTLYGEGDKSGKAWRLARWLSAHIVRPVLVGEKNMRQHQAMTRRSSINSILQDNPRLRSASQAAAVLDLFGSDDPDHLEQMEDVTPDSDSSEGDSPAASLGGSSDHDGSGSSSSEAML